MRLSLILVTLLALAVPAVAQDAPINPIRLNQAGLLAKGPKQAMVPDAAPKPLPWTLRDAKGQTVVSGTTRVTGDDDGSGQHLHLVDFSTQSVTGDGFTLLVGDKTSRPFAIGAGPYRLLKRDALAYFYHNRAGIPIETRYVGASWARPAGHPKEVAPCFGGQDKAGNDWPACTHSLNVTGGWYDAGDHGKYVVNGGISLWTLLNLYERQALRGKGHAFPDGSAAIPEAGNGVNDLLDEARWQMEFMLSMQAPAGARMALPLGAQNPKSKLVFTPDIDVSGMAHHKVADERWTGLPLAPHQDTERRFLYPPSTAATLNLAATAAQAARIWKAIDPAFAERCLKASVRAWQAALRVPDALALGDFNGSGGYGDGDVSDEFFWAASELLATTRQPLFMEVVTKSTHFQKEALVEPSWGQTAPLGALTLALYPEILSSPDTSRLRSMILRGAGGFLKEAQASGYRQPLAPRAYGWGSNSTLMNRAMILAYARDLTGEGKYRDGVVDVASYLLGRNPLDISYITGYGARSMQHPHHRFWARVLDPAFPPPPPGVVSGGPNITSLGEDARKRIGVCAPQTCWKDDIDLFTVNEVTINWNAPLVWLAAWLDEG
ncbi:glycoside hydrolase family 9 protein [Niveispirillum sp. KHB5.9]|uniref:glycoside hydrolase family 9 protein n=1 Tax=Niveispirillum sp. KHB5.9 TaxID=3400269 RepID=UPI003A8936DE